MRYNIISIMFIFTSKKLDKLFYYVLENSTLQNFTYGLQITKKCVRYIVSIGDLNNTKSLNILQLMVLGCSPITNIRTDFELPKTNKKIIFAAFYSASGEVIS